MRQLSITFLLIFFSLMLYLPADATIKGGVSYSIPIEYKNLSESELKNKADKYYYLAQKLKDGTVNQDMTNALLLYSILQNKNPDNIEYSVRLGILYGKIGKDRYAKGSFSRAIGINKNAYEPYFYFGEYYYKRQQYRSALRYYKRALEHTLNANYDLYYRLGDIYEKLGDTKTSLKYLELANQQSPNSELENKINRVKAYDSANAKYYGN